MTPKQYTINFFDDEPQETTSKDSGIFSHSFTKDDRAAAVPPSVAMRNRILEDDLKRQPICYMSFGSGSSGNSCYIGTRNGGVIVDAGVNSDIIETSLRANGVDMSNVKGLCLTHDHSDHVRYAYKLLRSHKHIKLYCTLRVLNAILRRHGISKRIKEYHQPIFKEIPFKIADFEITAFDVPHDAADNAGFHFLAPSGKTFVMATDLGAVSPRARHYMEQADYLMIEANYDAQMLRNGPYPEYLKARIATEHGHLDNEDTAALLKEIAGGRLKHIFLCHLSKDNNTPEKALSTIRGALEASGLRVGDGNETLTDRAADVQLQALPRFQPTRWYVFH